MTVSDAEAASPVRRVLVLTHTGRDAAREVTLSICRALTGHGIVVRLLSNEAVDLGIEPPTYHPAIEVVAPDSDPAMDCELAVVVGGSIPRSTASLESSRTTMP